MGGFADPQFVEEFGPGLHKLADSEIVTAALTLLIGHVATQPEGKTGLPLLDD